MKSVLRPTLFGEIDDRNFPIGTILWVAGEQNPDDDSWLPCNGTILDDVDTDYPELFKAMGGELLKSYYALPDEEKPLVSAEMLSSVNKNLHKTNKYYCLDGVRGYEVKEAYYDKSSGENYVDTPTSYIMENEKFTSFSKASLSSNIYSSDNNKTGWHLHHTSSSSGKWRQTTIVRQFLKYNNISIIYDRNNDFINLDGNTYDQVSGSYPYNLISQNAYKRTAEKSDLFLHKIESDEPFMSSLVNESQYYYWFDFSNEEFFDDENQHCMGGGCSLKENFDILRDHTYTFEYAYKECELVNYFITGVVYADSKDEIPGYRNISGIYDEYMSNMSISGNNNGRNLYSESVSGNVQRMFQDILDYYVFNEEPAYMFTLPNLRDDDTLIGTTELSAITNNTNGEIPNITGEFLSVGIGSIFYTKPFSCGSTFSNNYLQDSNAGSIKMFQVNFNASSQKNVYKDSAVKNVPYSIKAKAYIKVK